jgi:hypothetical protein
MNNYYSTGESGLRTAIIMDAVLRKFYRYVCCVVRVSGKLSPLMPHLFGNVNSNRNDDFWTRKHTWATPVSSLPTSTPPIEIPHRTA